MEEQQGLKKPTCSWEIFGIDEIDLAFVSAFLPESVFPVRNVAAARVVLLLHCHC